MLDTAAFQPGPGYGWGQVGHREGPARIMIDSGNTVGDLVSEEFADRLGLEGAIVEGEVKELTTAAARTLQIMRRGLAAKQEVEPGERAAGAPRRQERSRVGTVRAPWMGPRWSGALWALCL